MAQTFNQDVHDFIEDGLDNADDIEIVGSDIASVLAQGPNADGYWMHMGYDQAMQYLCDNREYADTVFQYQQDEWGKTLNPFENPCGFMISMLNYVLETILFDCPTILDNWNEDIVLTEDVRQSILDEANQIDIA